MDIDELRRENLELLAELYDQWELNHAEHCSNEWPHREGKICCYPLLPILNQFYQEKTREHEC